MRFIAIVVVTAAMIATGTTALARRSDNHDHQPNVTGQRDRARDSAEDEDGPSGKDPPPQNRAVNECTRTVFEASEGRAFGEGGGTATTADAQLGEIAATVEELRELRFEQLPSPRYLSNDELGARVEGEVEEAYPDELAALDARLLVALGLLEEGTDLKQAQKSALGSQVAGFYDDTTGELVVGGAADGAALDAVTQVFLAHELDHALTDQVMGLPVPAETPPPSAADEYAAGLALIEGDATLVMQLFTLFGLSSEDLREAMDTPIEGEEEFEALPYFIQRSMLFPYFDGLAFVCALYETGGWETVNEAYASPPETTAQVLYPERYFADEKAAPPVALGKLGAMWKLDRTGSFGALDLLMLFEAPGGRADDSLGGPLERAQAWAGGEFQQWTAGNKTAIGISLVEHADSPADLCASMRRWYESAFGATAKRSGDNYTYSAKNRSAVIECGETSVQVGIAPTLSDASALVS